ncbi:MRD1 [Hepatospora eriocheir]|uniref:MRD1 n=1 Tax=Hepatospora eriocheir TaxID=1081669 RepID=A0A1X0Q8C8_9MICR|nr:MRD1 [Hepatospora eriocheir]
MKTKNDKTNTENLKNVNMEAKTKNNNLSRVVQNDTTKIDNVGTSVFVKNLNFDTKESDIREAFKECGEIKIVRIPLAHTNTKNKGFCFIEFELVDGMKAALGMDGVKVLDRNINVSISLPRGKERFYTVFVKNLPRHTTREELIEYFEKFGKLHHLNLPISKEDKTRNAGYAFVEYLDEEVAKKVINMKLVYKNKRPLHLELGSKNDSRNKDMNKKYNYDKKEKSIKNDKKNKIEENFIKNDKRKKFNKKIIFNEDSSE